MLSTCITCATPLVAGAKFCVECGTPAPEEKSSIESSRAREIMLDLVAKTLVKEITKPNTFGKPTLEMLLARGDYSQGVTDFNGAFEDRPPLYVTLICVGLDEMRQTFEDFKSGCRQNLIGYVQTDDLVLFVSADYERETDLENGLERFGEALGGTVEVLIASSSNKTSDSGKFMYHTSEDIVEVFAGAGLVTTLAPTPLRYDLKDQVECSVFKYLIQPDNEDKLLLVAVYLGVPAKAMFSFDEAQNQATLSDENWIIEFSSNLLTPSEFKAAVALFVEEVGGELSA